MVRSPPAARIISHAPTPRPRRGGTLGWSGVRPALGFPVCDSHASRNHAIGNFTGSRCSPRRQGARLRPAHCGCGEGCDGNRERPRGRLGEGEKLFVMEWTMPLRLTVTGWSLPMPKKRKSWAGPRPPKNDVAHNASPVELRPSAEDLSRSRVHRTGPPYQVGPYCAC